MRRTPDFSQARTVLLALSLGFVGVFVACSSDPAGSPASGSSGTSGNGSSGSSPTISTAQCTSRCKTKLDRCGAPAEQTEQGCTQLCGGSVTEAQAACFEEKDCEKIAAAESVDELCPKSSSTPAPTDAGPGSSTPTTLTVKGSFGSVKATHASSNGKVASVFSAAPKPTFVPKEPSPLPNVADDGVTFTITSPDPGDCDADITFTLSSSQISVSVIGQDTLPATACATFTDAIAQNGLKATLKDVPYPNTTKATVTVELSP